MERASSAWTRVAAAVAVACVAFHVYRAVALPITVDEAFTFNRFVGASWLDLLRTYDANHHILHSVLCKISVGVFGPSEWSLRLPALAGCVIYVLFAYRLCRLGSGTGPAMLAGFLWLAGLPQIAEYMSLARGYSLGLGLFFAAMWEALKPGEPRWNRVSAWMGLSVASNLVFVVPCTALGLLALRRSRNFRALAAPALAVLAWALAVPLQHASMENYYFGAKTWNECVHSLLVYPWLKLAAAAVLGLALAAAWKREELRAPWHVLATSLALIGVLFAFRGVPLPYERTGIYLLALVALLAGPACRWPRVELPLAAACGAVALAAFSHVSAYQSGVWTFDSFNRAAMQRIRQEAAGTPAVVAASFPLEHGTEFYRRAWRLPWPEIAQWREGATAHFLIWRTDESHAPLPAGYRALARDERSGVILGVRSAER